MAIFKISQKNVLKNQKKNGGFELWIFFNHGKKWTISYILCVKKNGTLISALY
jgi:hypothetical protein